MQSNTILVTGGAGFIGSTFVSQMVARGYHVIVLDSLTYAGSRENLDWITPGETSGSWQLVEGDIRDGELVQTLLAKHTPDMLFHLAAESHVDNSIAGAAVFIDTNITGTYQLLEAARNYWEVQGKPEAFRFVHISTDEVYGSLGAEGAFSEVSHIQPNSPYSASKAASDMLARAWFHTYGLPTIITRCSNNYGPRQHTEKLIPHMIRCALDGKPLPVYGDGGNVRDWIHVEDHGQGIWLAAQKGVPGEAYNFGGHMELDNLSLVKKLCALLDTHYPSTSGKSYAEQITFVTDRLGHDRRYAMDDAKARKELGFTNAYHFDEGLATTVNWYLERRK